MNNNKILAIPGDFWHQPLLYKAFIQDTFNDYNLTYILEHQNLNTVTWKDYDLIILAREAKIAPQTSDQLWYTPSQEQELADYVYHGGKLFALHSGLASYPEESLFRSLMKGAFMYHPEEHPDFEIVPVQNTLADLYLRLKDEMYFVWTDSARTEILMESRSPDYGSSAAMWRHTYGNGKVFCYTPGHRQEVLQQPEYKKAVRFGAQWLLDNP